jgi:uncharacterized small protein (DUF1192 family)
MITEDDTRNIAPAHVLGQDLSSLSIDELDERMHRLAEEIERLKQARHAKEASRKAADSFFR